jgi:predicted secreted protein
MPRPLAVRDLLLCCGALLLGAGATARADTILHLGETATVMVQPDELAADLRAEATRPTPAEAQAQVNAAMKDALAEARAVSGLTVSTGGYGVWRVGPTEKDHSERWQAGQTLQLSGHDDATLLKLVGALQEKGLAVSNLGWRLSREAERRAHQEATRQALSSLSGRIKEAADLLHLRFDQFKEIRLDSAAPSQPILRSATMARTMATAAPPPSVVAEDVPVSATAEADAILTVH